MTNSQYAEFLNAKGVSDTVGIFNVSMAGNGITQNGISGAFTYTVDSGFANKPVAYVSWFDAARFTNWLGNGQGNGDMENGAYTLDGKTTGDAVAKNSGATVYVPSENEWYKAAYYQGDAAVYALFPNGQNIITNADANFNSNVGQSTNVGTYFSDPSFYGTFDQGGNFWEWNDLTAVSGAARGLRGGSWDSADTSLASTNRIERLPSKDLVNDGFRVASSDFSAVPEPRSMLLGLALLTSGLLRRTRS